MICNRNRRNPFFRKARAKAAAGLLLWAFFCTFSAPEAAELPANQPVEITSDRLEADYSKGKIHFLGEVVARQGDLTIYSEELIIHLDQGDGGNRQVKEIEALKNVRIVKGTRVATGQAAHLDNATGKVVLTGSPRVEEGENFVEGDKITFFLNEDRSTVKSDSGSRAKAVFHPKEKGNGP
jgi:lipopolysaccharide export system protein LptA